jgi:Flp pilus assembly protein TadB
MTARCIYVNSVLTFVYAVPTFLTDSWGESTVRTILIFAGAVVVLGILMLSPLILEPMFPTVAP